MSRRLTEVEEAAATWDARLRGARATLRDRRIFQIWLQQAPEHQAAHDRLQAVLTTLRAHVELLELSALRDEARNSVREKGRRRLVSAVSVAVAAILLLVLGVGLRTHGIGQIAGQRQDELVYRTSLKERAKVTLADGSVVTLDSGSQVSVSLGKTRRDVTLLAGRALFQVARDQERPFVVRAGDRTVTALGTVFDVQLSPGALRVTLAEGSVVVRPVDPRRGAASRILRPNQQFVEVAGVALPELRTVDTYKTLSWAEGQVLFEDEPLAGAAEEMNQYSQLKIVVDPAVADLRINGMFRTSNQAGFVEALQLTLPVRVRNDGDGRIFVSRRPDPAAGGSLNRNDN